MKQIFTTLLFLNMFILNIGYSQFEIEESFEQNACTASSSNIHFYDLCFDDWISANGSPHSVGGDPYDGNNYVHMYCFEKDNVSRGEGIILNYDFLAGVTYEIRFYAKGTNPGSGNSVTRKVILITENEALPNIFGYANSPGEIIPDIPNNAVNIHDINISTSSWVLNEIVYTPSQNFAQLWIRPETNNLSNVILNIDYFTLELLCDDDYSVGYHFEHATGEQDDEFKVCEQIIVDGTESSNSMYQRIRLRDLTANTEVVTPWQGTLPNPLKFDITNYIETNYPNTNLDFIEGHDYELKLSFYDLACEWEHLIDYFSIKDEVDCTVRSDLTACAEEGNYGFILMDCEGKGMSYYWEFPINSTAILVSYNAGIVQASEGTYKVTVINNCGTATEFEFEIVADCCELKCESPEIYGCDTTIDGEGTESVTFYWENIPSAVDGYEVLISLDACCNNGPGGQLNPIIVDQTYHTYTPPWWVSCLSWTVRSICDENDGIYSENNQTYCYNTNSNSCVEINDPQDNIGSRNSDLQKVEYDVYPNPNSGNEIFIKFASTERSDLVVEIYNIQGDLIESMNTVTDEEGSFQKTWNPDTPLVNGMYTVSFRTKSNSYTTKLLVVTN